MTREENIRAILDTCFSESKDEIKEVALNNIMSLSADAVDVAHDIPEYCSWSQTYTNMVQSAMLKASAEAEPQMEHDREWIIGCIKHDGFIKTDRFDKANQIILDALQFAEHFDLLKEHESLQEVVRCKDCRHRDLFSCPLADNDFQKDDDYCSWGERREE